MDEYGSYRQTEDDWLELAHHLRSSGTIVFPWSHNQIDSYIILVSVDFQKLGIMPWGGNPNGRAYVALLKRGCDHVRVDGEIFPSDLEEKLHMDKSGAEELTKLLNYILPKATH